MTDIDRERKELDEAPKIPVIVGEVVRCHLCGRIVPAEQLNQFEIIGGVARLKGGCCGAN
jgi:hypothetical protein